MVSSYSGLNGIRGGGRGEGEGKEGRGAFLEGFVSRG